MIYFFLLYAEAILKHSYFGNLYSFTVLDSIAHGKYTTRINIAVTSKHLTEPPLIKPIYSFLSVISLLLYFVQLSKL